MKDPYSVLGTNKAATAEEIKKAYRDLAKKHHPDLNPNDKNADKKFKEVSAAYALLSDADKKARFDRGEIDVFGNPTGFGGGFGARGAAGGRSGKRKTSFNMDDLGFDPNDLFNEIFGNRKASQRQQTQSTPKGNDATYTLPITFMEAALGAKKRLTLGTRTLDINIPVGSEDGQTLRLKGQGDRSEFVGGTTGDALIKLKLDNTHLFYTRKGNDIYCDLPITLQEAVLGDVVTVPTLHGNVSLKIPSGANTGLTMRLKGKGIQKEPSIGDQYIKLKVVLPDVHDKDLVNFVKKWAGSHNYDPRKKEGLI
jgi:DnaJ-class molecular chaperone